MFVLAIVVVVVVVEVSEEVVVVVTVVVVDVVVDVVVVVVPRCRAKDVYKIIFYPILYSGLALWLIVAPLLWLLCLLSPWFNSRTCHFFF